MSDQILHLQGLREVHARRKGRRSAIERSSSQLCNLVEKDLAWLVTSIHARSHEAHDVSLVALPNRDAFHIGILELTTASAMLVRDHKQDPSGIRAFLEHIEAQVHRVRICAAQSEIARD